jgi:hypothetical protein
MLGHLVLGRYSADGETRGPIVHEPGWMTRVIRSLFRKRH